VGCELAGFFQYRGNDVGVEIAVMAGLHGSLQAGAMVERQQHVRDRCAVGHGLLPGTSLAPYSHETPGASTAGTAPAGTGPWTGYRSLAQPARARGILPLQAVEMPRRSL